MAETASTLSASDQLLRLIENHPTPRIAFGDLLHGLGHRGFGLLLLLLAIPNSFPIPSLPGVSTLFGVPMMLLAGQLAWGMQEPWLPGFLRRRSMARADLIRLLTKAKPHMEKVERCLRPRLPAMATGHSRRLGGLIAFLMAGIMALPIVFGNFLPAFSVLLISLALIEEDGAVMLAGYTVAIIATAVVSLIVYIGVEAVHLALSSLLGW